MKFELTPFEVTYTLDEAFCPICTGNGKSTKTEASSTYSGALVEEPRIAIGASRITVGTAELVLSLDVLLMVLLVALLVVLLVVLVEVLMAKVVVVNVRVREFVAVIVRVTVRVAVGALDVRTN